MYCSQNTSSPISKTPLGLNSGLKPHAWRSSYAKKYTRRQLHVINVSKTLETQKREIFTQKAEQYALNLDTHTSAAKHRNPFKRHVDIESIDVAKHKMRNKRYMMKARKKVEKEKTNEKAFGGSLKGLLMLNAGALLFGSNQVTIKTTESSITPGGLTAIRFALAALCFAPNAAKGFRNPELRNASMELALWLFGGYTAQAIGLYTTTAARGAFTGTFTVLAVPILVGLSGRRISKTTWIAAVLALAGVGMLTSSGMDPNVGDLWCILSAVLFGVHKWRSESTTAKFSDSTQELVAVQITTLAAISAIYCVPQGCNYLLDVGVNNAYEAFRHLPWLSIAYMGIGTTALTLWFEMESLKEVSAPMAALIYTAEPLWGALFAYMILGERWGALGWAGAALIIFSSLYAQFSGDNSEKPIEKLKQNPNELIYETKEIPAEQFLNQEEFSEFLTHDKKKHALKDAQ